MNPSTPASPMGAETNSSLQYRPSATASRMDGDLSTASTMRTISCQRPAMPSASACARAALSRSVRDSRSMLWRTACTARPIAVPARPRRHGGTSSTGGSFWTLGSPLTPANSLTISVAERIGTRRRSSIRRSRSSDQRLNCSGESSKPAGAGSSCGRATGLMSCQSSSLSLHTR